MIEQSSLSNANHPILQFRRSFSSGAIECCQPSLTTAHVFYPLRLPNRFIYHFTFIMSYRAGIIEAVSELKDRTGSSMIAIKKFMQEKLPKDKKWQNATFLAALKTGVEKGEFIKLKNSYKLSADFKKKAISKAKADAKPKKEKKAAAPKKAKATKKKTTTVKKVSCFLYVLSREVCLFPFCNMYSWPFLYYYCRPRQRLPRRQLPRRRLLPKRQPPRRQRPPPTRRRRR